LSHIAESVGIEPKFIELATSTNLNMPSVVARQIDNFIQGGLSGKRIQIAGIAYKPGVPDMRESPVLYLIKELEKFGGEVIWCDPLVGEFNGEISTPLKLDIDLGLIVTPHEDFDFSIWKNSKIQVLDLSPNSNNYGWPKFL
jgi:UDP-N-acetyl-D-glucosamine dehydrogenase